MKNATFIFAAMLTFLVEGLAAEPFTEQLSDEQFKAAGLEKLSDAELESLNELWIQLSTEPAAIAPSAPPPPPTAAIPVLTAAPIAPSYGVEQDEDLVGKEQVLNFDPQKAPKKFESRLVGKFEGWSGETTFELENGQVWIQRIDDTQKYTPSDSPKVTVYKGIGGYRIRFDGYNQSCAVRRVK